MKSVGRKGHCFGHRLELVLLGNVYRNIIFHTDCGVGSNSSTNVLLVAGKFVFSLMRETFAAFRTKLTYFFYLLLRLTHPEGPYGSAATSSTNNPESVEDLSQGQMLQSESSNAAEGNEQRHEDEVS